MTTARTIIQQLGGPDAVASITGAKLNAIRQWERIGIPYRFWPVIQAKAAEIGADGVTPDALIATKPPARARLAAQASAA